MKKYILLILVILCLTGCKNIYDMDYDTIINKTFNQKIVSKKNNFLKGYKLYLPPHMIVEKELNSNAIITSYKEKYYLYTDLVSYQNKIENRYEIKKEAYEFSKSFTKNKKQGYVIISDSKGGKLVEIMYNYAKIEVITKDPKKAIASGILILKNIEYNKKIIDSMIGTNILTYDTEEYNLLGPKKEKTDKFLTYEKEFGEYDEEKNKDEDMIDYEVEE